MRAPMDKVWTPRPDESGTMAARVRAHNWAGTPLGALHTWPERLRGVVELMLASPLLSSVAVGPERVLVYNDAAARFYGDRHPAALGRPLGEMFPEAFPAAAPLYDRVFAGHAVTVEAEHLDIRADNSGEMFDAYLTPVFGADGAVIAAHMAGFEVGDRVRAENALRQSEMRYRTLFEAIDSGFCVIEMIYGEDGRAIDYRIIEANPAFERQSGLVGAVGRRIREFAPDLEEHWFERYGQVARTGEPARFQNKAAPLGRWFDTDAFRVGAPEECRVAVLFTDITARRDAEDEARESKERQAFLLRLGDALWAEPSADPIADRALRMLFEQMRLDRCYIGIYRPTEDRGEFPHQVHDDCLLPLPAQVRLSELPKALQVTFDRTLVIDDIEEMASLSDSDRASLNGLDLRALISATVRKGENDPLWAVVAGSACARVWTQGEVALFEEVAERTLAAVERARTEARLATELEGTRMLRDVSSKLLGANEPQALYDGFVDVAMTLMQSDAASMQILDSSGERLDLVASRGFPPQSMALWQSVDVSSQSSCAKALRAGKRAAVPDVEADAAMAGTFTLERYRRSNIRSAQSTPLSTRNGKSLGMISAYWRDPRPFAEEDFALFDILARQAADLIERMQSDATLRKSEELLRQFGEASQDVLWMRDAEKLQWTYLTPAFERVYGLSREEALTGNDYRNWLDLIVPEDRDHAAASIDRVRHGEWVTFEYRVRRPLDGRIVWLRDTDFPITDHAGRILTIGGIGHDVTNLKRIERELIAAQERQRLLIEGIPQLVWRASEPGLWTWASPQWTACTGQGDAASHGLGWLDPVHPDDRAAAREAWDGAVEAGELEVEYRLLLAGNGYRWFQSRALPVRDANDAIIEWLGTSTDIDDMRHMQERQHVLLAELQHRVRNILTVVRSVFNRTAERGGNLEDLLDHFRGRLDALARTQVIVTQTAHGGVDLQNLIRDELLSVGVGQHENEGLTIDGPDVLLGPKEAESLGLAIHELTTNALKYGALKVPKATLDIRWSINIDDGGGSRLDLIWKEQGVPVVAIPTSGGGFGRELIENALPYRLGAETEFEFKGGGVQCRISVPMVAAVVDATGTDG